MLNLDQRWRDRLIGAALALFMALLIVWPVDGWLSG
jgi:hypothetical protein